MLRIRAMREMEIRRSSETTYTMPLTKAPDMKEFLQDFYTNIYKVSKKQFYAEEREKYPNSVGKFFNELCCGSQQLVTFEDFWQRYEYRCSNIDRIMRELSDIDAFAAAKKKSLEAAEAAKRQISGGATNLWDAVVTSINEATGGGGENDQQRLLVDLPSSRSQPSTSATTATPTTPTPVDRPHTVGGISPLSDDSPPPPPLSPNMNP